MTEPAASSEAAWEAELVVDEIEVRPGRNLAIHYRKKENCEDTVFLIHGSCASLLQWRSQVRHFAENYNVVAYDVFGCGRSAKPEIWEGYSSVELHRDLAAVVHRYNLAGRNVLIGHSAGSSFILRLAAEAAGETDKDCQLEDAVRARSRCFSGLVLLSCLPSLPGSINIFRLPLPVLKVLQPMLSSGFESRAFDENTCHGNTPEHRELLSVARESAGKNPMFMCKAYYRQLKLPTRKQLDAVKLPILMIWGESDKIVNVKASDLMAEMLSHAKAHKVAKAAHQVMQEQPEECNRLIDSFLEGLPRC